MLLVAQEQLVLQVLLVAQEQLVLQVLLATLGIRDQLVLQGQLVLQVLLVSLVLLAIQEVKSRCVRSRQDQNILAEHVGETSDFCPDHYTVKQV